MQLSYRGVGYEQSAPLVDLIDSGLSGRYRNQALAFQYPRHIPTTQPMMDLSYRAMAYRTTADGSVESLPTRPKPAHSVACSARHDRQRVLSEASETHRQVILSRLHHRLNVAQESGNTMLAHQLEQEMQQFS